MPPALGRRHEYAGPTLFSYGFRPFFLGGALWAALGILLWLPQYFGELSLPTAFAPLDWHIHEMIFGFLAADCHRLPADRNFELDRAAAGQRLSVGRPRRALAGGSRSGGWFCDLGRWARRRDRRRLPRYARGGGVARDRRRQELAQPPCPHRARRADCQQCSVPSRSDRTRQR